MPNKVHMSAQVATLNLHTALELLLQLTSQFQRWRLLMKAP